jgi:uncharacterized protein (TIGR00730 family)
MKRVCVFLGSSPGARPEYAEATRVLGRELVARGLELVYGGGNVGLMGVLADAVLEAGGHVIGVIPESLVVREVAHTGLPDLRRVRSMHERKAMMADLSDAFVTLPGGIGTFEECFEILTWAQLGMHESPCGLLDVAGYWRAMRAMLQHAVEERFLRPEHVALLHVAKTPAALLDALAHARPPQVRKWIDRDAV